MGWKEGRMRGTLHKLNALSFLLKVYGPEANKNFLCSYMKEKKLLKLQ